MDKNIPATVPEQTVPPTPAPASIPGTYKTVPVDNFLNDLKNKPTEGDLNQANQQGQPPPPPPPVTPEKRETLMMAKMVVNTTDVGMQLVCQSISGETDASLFKTTEDQRQQIIEPLAELMEFYKVQFHPGWLLLLAVMATYAKPVAKATSIKKDKAKKAKQQSGQQVYNLVEKPGPGRPTKEQQEARKKQQEQNN